MDLVKDPQVPAHLAAKYEARADHYWDLFYRRNQDRFFKDRHYFEAEFPQLLAARTVLEVGCGAGNTVFPLLELNPGASIYACDFAPSAVGLVRAHPAYATTAGRVHAFVADITADDLTVHVPPGCVDACTMVFVLSAIAPEAMPRVLRRVARTLRPGAQLLFRDYAAGDLAEERLSSQGRQQQLGPNFYVRWDGTRAFYFTEGFLRRLFEGEGFCCQYVRVDERVQENRARGARMDRRFVQAVFTFSGGGGSDCGTSGSITVGGGSERQPDSSTTEGGRDWAPSQTPPPQQREEGEPELEEVRLRLGAGSPGPQLQLQVLCPPTLQQGAATAAAAADKAAAEALATLVLSCPALFHGTNVLEMCSWHAPLAALAALRWCRHAVAAGGSEAAVQLLRRNARRNGHLFVIERLRLQLLTWRGPWHQHGEAEGGEDQQRQRQYQQEQLLRAFPAGFDAVVAAAPADASAADLHRLLSTAAALMCRRQRSPTLLCVAAQPAMQQAVVEAAAGVGLGEAPTLAPEVVAAAAAALPLHIVFLQVLYPCA